MVSLILGDNRSDTFLQRSAWLGLNVSLFLVIFMIFTPKLMAQQIHHRAFFSPTLKNEWRYSIYLPKVVSEHPEEKYPVIFMLHGMFNTDKSFETKKFASLINDLIEKNLIDPVIVVFPNGFRQSWWVDSEAFGSIESAFFHDLLPHIALYYAISTDPQKRVIAGISMGGFGALNYAFHHSDTFAHLWLFSPALFLPSPLNPETHPDATPGNWRERIVLRNVIQYRAFAFAGEAQPFNALLFIPKTYPYLHERRPDRLAELDILLFYGDADPITDSGTRFLHDFFTEHVPHAKIFVTPSAGHQWSLWRTDFARALQATFPYINQEKLH
ncbi:alpha/beta hydrolase [Entomospira culicis]|uniref:Esterase n=1 Tax=Entomospira culicis TaxID=2719989 RepID=A0A968KW53_9SPIO|nr:alpha/beta hydrolase-fold protein [Entomospira culicis]NIZ18597.1 hypothetical protein [Entomospira culicis]NIZ68812.1 hypothetical protein [Entomospira culicis]WDI37408.1 alpha/beta hydrolase-fold protein [Entomospira culicis]WDI39036.1 alpha/beta hydrolase-fold protein [Entomospira culicis]